MQITKTINYILSLKDQRFTVLMLTACYFVFWLMLRIDSVFANVLYADDFLLFVDHGSSIIGYDTCKFPAQDYRWLSSGILCFLATYLADFSLSPLFKLLGGLLLSGFACSLYCCFKTWGVNGALSAVTPLIILSHPIVNEITLWNTTSVTPFWFLSAATAYLILSYSANAYYRVLAVMLLLALVLAYEYSLIVFLLLVVSEPFIRYINGKDIEFKKVIVLTLIFTGVAVFYVLQVKLSNVIFPTEFETGRGLVKVQGFDVFLKEKVHGVFNLVVNVYMTPMSYFIPLERSWSLWKWVPICIMVLTFTMTYIKKRSFLMSLVYSAFVIAIVLLPTVSLFASSQSPESWRVSAPLLVGFACSLLPMAIILTSSYRQVLIKTAAYFLLLVLVMLQSLVSMSEADLRVAENDLEKSLLINIDDYWRSNGFGKEQFRIGRIKMASVAANANLHPAQNLSVAYSRRELLLALRMDFAWRGRLLFDGFRVIELSEDDSILMKALWLPCTEALCKLELESELRKRCHDKTDIIQWQTGLRVVHDLKNKFSVICT